MSCPTCDHTMHGLAGGYFWCPRCGHLNQHPDDVIGNAPRLVERCRDFEGRVIPAQDETTRAFLAVKWRMFGIAESINLPGDRPQ